jgi:hypothetical protein
MGVEIQLDWQRGRMVPGRVIYVDIRTPIFTTSYEVTIMAVLQSYRCQTNECEQIKFKVNIGIPPLRGKYLAGQSN